MTTDTIIEDLVALCDTHPYALAEHIPAVNLTLALYHELSGGAVAADQAEGWLDLQAQGLARIMAHTDLQPGSDAMVATLLELYRTMIDDSYND